MRKSSSSAFKAGMAYWLNLNNRLITYIWLKLITDDPYNQSLKAAVLVTLCQNEADVKFQMDIDSHISFTEQAGKIRKSDFDWHVGVNIYLTFYICLILAEGHNNCSF